MYSFQVIAHFGSKLANFNPPHLHLSPFTWLELRKAVAEETESVKYIDAHPTFLFDVTDDLVEAISRLSQAKNVPELCMHQQSAHTHSGHKTIRRYFTQ